MATNDVFLRPDAGDGTNGVRLRPDAADGGTNYQVDALAGTYSLTGQALTVSRNRVATVLNGSYALTGQAITVSRNRVATPANGVYSLVGQAATINRDRIATVQNGSYTLTGQAATVNRNRVATPINGVYALSGQVIEVVYTPSAVNYQIDAQAGTYAVSGQTIGVEKSTPAIFVDGGWGAEKPRQKKTRKVRKDIEEAYALLIEHPEPSIVREVREIVGNAQLDTLAQPKVTQLLTLAREVEEEEELLMLLI